MISIQFDRGYNTAAIISSSCFDIIDANKYFTFYFFHPVFTEKGEFIQEYIEICIIKFDDIKYDERIEKEPLSSEILKNYIPLTLEKAKELTIEIEKEK